MYYSSPSHALPRHASDAGVRVSGNQPSCINKQQEEGRCLQYHILTQVLGHHIPQMNCNPYQIVTMVLLLMYVLTSTLRHRKTTRRGELLRKLFTAAVGNTNLISGREKMFLREISHPSFRRSASRCFDEFSRFLSFASPIQILILACSLECSLRSRSFACFLFFITK